MNLTNSKKVLYLLGAGVLISLVLNISLLYALFSVRNKAVTAMDELTDELNNLKNETITLTYHIEEMDMPAFTATLDEPIEVEIPLDTSVTVPIKDDLVSYISILGIKQKIILPVETTVTVPIKETVTIELPIQEITFKRLDVPTEMELKMEETLEELGLGNFIDRIIELIRQLLESL